MNALANNDRRIIINADHAVREINAHARARAGNIALMVTAAVLLALTATGGFVV